jgi:hypothetical protein
MLRGEQREYLTLARIGGVVVAILAEPDRRNHCFRRSADCQARAAGRRHPGRTVDWLLRLAPAARPTHLADAMPRIANALADRWSDTPAAAAYVGDLLIDRRGGRKGFPPEIKGELVMLHLMLRRSLATRS